MKRTIRLLSALLGAAVFPVAAWATDTFIESPAHLVTLDNGVLDGTPTSRTLERADAVAPIVPPEDLYDTWVIGTVAGATARQEGWLPFTANPTNTGPLTTYLRNDFTQIGSPPVTGYTEQEPDGALIHGASQTLVSTEYLRLIPLTGVTSATSRTENDVTEQLSQPVTPADVLARAANRTLVWPTDNDTYSPLAIRSVTTDVQGRAIVNFEHLKYRVQTYASITTPVTFRWWEVFVPTIGSTPTITSRSWSGNGPATGQYYIDPRTANTNGYWEIYPKPVRIRVFAQASRSIPGSTLSEGSGQSGPLYAGNKTGDLVQFSADMNYPHDGVLSSLTPTNYNWQAFGPLTSIQGPAGPTASQWVMDGANNSDEDYRVFNWMPGVWTIRCTVTFSDGTTYVAENQQDVGWRTERYLVTGQVRPINDVKPTEAETAVIKQEIIDSWNMTVARVAILPLWPYGSVSLPGFLQDQSAETNAFLWFMVAAFPGFVNQPAASEDHRIWMLQAIFNKEPDKVVLDATLTSKIYNQLIADASYRMLTEVQAQYLLDTQRHIRHVEFLPAGQRQAIGPTKLFTDQGLLMSLFSVLPKMYAGANQLHAVAEAGQYHGAQRLANDGQSVSVMTAGRIGYAGNQANLKLFGRQAPFIYTELLFKIGADGRDGLSSINLSVDKSWTDLGNNESLITGSCHFNEIRIYERDPTASDATYVQRDALLIADQIHPFILSVSPSQTAEQIQPKPTLR